MSVNDQRVEACLRHRASRKKADREQDLHQRGADGDHMQPPAGLRYFPATSWARGPIVPSTRKAWRSEVFKRTFSQWLTPVTVLL